MISFGINNVTGFNNKNAAINPVKNRSAPSIQVSNLENVLFFWYKTKANSQPASIHNKTYQYGYDNENDNFMKV